MESAMDSQFYIGRRLSYDSQLCTVRYIGEVTGTKSGTWLGVEWDDPTRGKHTGEHNGVKYFECISQKPKAGSFVRPSRPADISLTFVDAIRRKYASEITNDGTNTQGHVAGDESDIRISGKTVEKVGFEKVRKQLADLQKLRIVILDGLCIARPQARSSKEPHDGLGSFRSNASDVQDTCSKVVELDLSRNLFEEWDEIIDICKQLPDLESLRADGNRLRFTSSELRGPRPKVLPSEHLKTISLEDTLLSWTDIVEIISFWPSLSSLTASGNELCRLPSAPISANLVALVLERNEFYSLSDLEPLTTVGTLQKLGLKTNSICCLLNIPGQAGEGGRLPTFTTNLQEVDLSYNAISSWEFIDRLDQVFPGMTTLRVSHNPLYENLKCAADGKKLLAEDGYMLTMARLGRLTQLNFSKITPKERLNAEAWYLSQIGFELSLASPTSAPTIISSHARYAELCEQYGEPTVKRETISSGINPNALAARLITIVFRLGDSILNIDTDYALRKAEVEIPRSFTIYNVLSIVGKKFKLPPMQLKLICEDGDDASVPSNEAASGNSVPKEEVLVPRTRNLGTWIDGMTANVRVEWSEQDRSRTEAARTRRN